MFGTSLADGLLEVCLQVLLGDVLSGDEVLADVEATAEAEGVADNVPECVGVGHVVSAVRERIVARLGPKKQSVRRDLWVDARKEAALASGAQLGLQWVARQALARIRRSGGGPLERGGSGGRRSGRWPLTDSPLF